jgi:hypothetical protein
VQVLGAVPGEVAVAGVLLELQPRDHERLGARVLVRLRRRLERGVGECEEEP